MSVLWQHKRNSRWTSFEIGCEITDVISHDAKSPIKMLFQVQANCEAAPQGTPRSETQRTNVLVLTPASLVRDESHVALHKARWHLQQFPLHPRRRERRAKLSARLRNSRYLTSMNY